MALEELDFGEVGWGPKAMGNFQWLNDTLVRFRDLDGNEIPAKVVTIVVDTDTDQVQDIIVEDVP